MDIISMRKKQLVVLNLFLLLFEIIFFFIINVFAFTLVHFALLAGVFLFAQTMHQFLKRNSTKSWISVLQQVKIYEKQILRDEWKHPNKANFVLGLCNVVIFFVLAYVAKDLDIIVQVDNRFMLLFSFSFY